MAEEEIISKKNLNIIDNFEDKGVSQIESVDLPKETVVEKQVDLGSITDQENKKTKELLNASSGGQKTTVASVVVPEVKSDLRQAVERVMEADLKDLYIAMNPTERLAFKKKGEETAREITLEVEKPRINLKRILKLLFEWLSFIPGINRFFIEQESKLKADQIIKMSK